VTPEKTDQWDRFYLEWAIRLGHEFSKDPKVKVGAILVNNKTLVPASLGYNGRGAGRPNERFSLEQGKSGFAHAEMNCLAKASWDHSCDYSLYLPVTPCLTCAALILNNPITRVVYRDVYTAEPGLEELLASGRIECLQKNF
jgi:dCMP deaminase